MNVATRRVGYPESAPPPVFAYPSVDSIKSHPLYRDAKGGDALAAMRLVVDRVPRSLLYDLRAAIPMNPWFVPAISMEARGCNAIPIAFARYLADGLGGDVWLETIQSSKSWHTGADMMERLVCRPRFDGRAPRDRPCILVDDVSTSGSTLAELANHLQLRDAHIAGCAVLVNASRSLSLAPAPQVRHKLSLRLGAVIEDELGIHPLALTRDECDYLIGFRSADELRNRAAQARSSLDRRRLQAAACAEQAADARPRPGRCFDMTASPVMR